MLRPGFHCAQDQVPAAIYSHYSVKLLLVVKFLFQALVLRYLHLAFTFSLACVISDPRAH